MTGLTGRVRFQHIISNRALHPRSLFSLAANTHSGPPLISAHWRMSSNPRILGVPVFFSLYSGWSQSNFVAGRMSL